MATKRNGVPCYDKAHEDEPLFVLRAQDIYAPLVVKFWAFLASHLSALPKAKLDEALQCANDMDKWKTRKHPD